MKSSSIPCYVVIYEHAFPLLARNLQGTLTKMNGINWKEVNAGRKLRVNRQRINEIQ
jgi:hypothetical protein